MKLSEKIVRYGTAFTPNQKRGLNAILDQTNENQNPRFLSWYATQKPVFFKNLDEVRGFFEKHPEFSTLSYIERVPDKEKDAFLAS